MSHDNYERDEGQDMNENDLQISMPGFKDPELVSQSKDEISFDNNEESEMGEENSAFWKSEANERADDKSSQVKQSNQDKEEVVSSHDSDLERFEIENSDSESAAKQEEEESNVQATEQENAEQEKEQPTTEEQKQEQKTQQPPVKVKKENRFWEYRKKAHKPVVEQQVLIPVYSEEERIRLSIESASNYNQKLINNKAFVTSIIKPVSFVTFTTLIN